MHRILRVVLSFLLFVGTGIVSVAIAQAPANAASELSGTNILATNYVTTSNSQVTVGCASNRDLTSYDLAADNVLMQLNRTQRVDGVSNCIVDPVMGKWGTVYGVPQNLNDGRYGPNLIAFDGGMIRWRYPLTPLSCGAPSSHIAIGSGGVVYALSETQSGTHLIGIAESYDNVDEYWKPTKVFDVPVTTGCNVELYLYDTGIAIRDLSSVTKFLFYSYDGTYLGQRSDISGGVLGGAINSHGRLFAMSGSDMRMLKTYSPNGQEVGSGYNAGATIESIHPLPNGGVMLSLYLNYGRQSLRILDVNLVQVGRDLELPQDSNMSYSLARIAINDVGQAIVVQSRTDWQQKQQTTFVSVVSSTNRVIRQDSIAGYGFFYDQPEGNVKLSGGRVLFQAQPNIDNFEGVLYSHDMSNVGFDYPLFAVMGGGFAAPPRNYVAMGDSFSSGEGNPDFSPWTDRDGVNECHRSKDKAYPSLLAHDSSLNLNLVDFVACSGATTKDVLGLSEANDPRGKWNEPPQIDALSENTDIVTITIGGNDVGFSDYAYACTITLCGPGTFDYNYIMNAINDSDFYNNLVLTYETILNQAPNAQVYVVNYPYLAAEDSDVCGQVDLTGAWAVESQLNSVIDDAVDNVSTTNLNFNIHYIDTTRSGSPFAGKYLCSGSESDFNGVHWSTNKEYSLHPNTSGQQDYATVIKNKLL